MKISGCYINSIDNETRWIVINSMGEKEIYRRDNDGNWYRDYTKSEIRCGISHEKQLELAYRKFAKETLSYDFM